MSVARSRIARAALSGLMGSALLFGAVDTAAPAGRTQEQLTQVVDALDSALSDAFNTCADPVQLAKHAAYFDPAVEFYQQPAVIDGYDPRRFIANESFALRPSV